MMQRKDEQEMRSSQFEFQDWVVVIDQEDQEERER
jgi:hypothetical protein